MGPRRAAIEAKKILQDQTTPPPLTPPADPSQHTMTAVLRASMLLRVAGACTPQRAQVRAPGRWLVAIGDGGSCPTSDMRPARPARCCRPPGWPCLLPGLLAALSCTRPSCAPATTWRTRYSACARPADAASGGGAGSPRLRPHPRAPLLCCCRAPPTASSSASSSSSRRTAPSCRRGTTSPSTPVRVPCGGEKLPFGQPTVCVFPDGGMLSLCCRCWRWPGQLCLRDPQGVVCQDGGRHREWLARVMGVGGDGNGGGQCV